MSSITLGRADCGDLAIARRKEWLVTNGLGGFASGTVAGVNTRRYHGLLVAALRPPVDRTVLVAKLDAETVYDGRRYALATNAFADGTIDPRGYRYVETFRLDGLIPTWSYALGDAILEQRVWMAHGANTTYVTYTLARGSDPMHLAIRPLCTYRDFHHLAVPRWEADIRPVPGGVEIASFPDAQPYRVVADRGTYDPIGVWYRAFEHGVEAERGFDHVEDLYVPGHLHASLDPGETLTLVCSTDPVAPHAGAEPLAAQHAREAALLAECPADDPDWIHQLVLAADQFIVRRDMPSVDHGGAARPAGRSAIGDIGNTVIAGYPWFADWGRDTMIALPGLALATARPEIAADVVRTFARHVSQGMLPNRFPDNGPAPDYNAVDATLWYFDAIDAYVRQTGDLDLARELFPVLVDIVQWHERGTRHGIGRDPEDGLLRAGEPGVQLTWMDAKVGDSVITPRIGKPVEVNALWHHALCVMADLAMLLGDGPAAEHYRADADRVAAAFRAGFWNAIGGYLYDVIDGPEGEFGPDGRRRDASLRPNQILAVALPHPVLDAVRARSVVDVCARRLWTSYGLRSLAADDPRFVGRYAGGPAARDAAYHQGTVWAWLAGPFAVAHYRVYGDPVTARSFLAPFAQHLADAGLGSISEVFDSDPPHEPHGCPAQAWSVAAVLAAWRRCTTTSTRASSRKH